MESLAEPGRSGVSGSPELSQRAYTPVTPRKQPPSSLIFFTAAAVTLALVSTVLGIATPSSRNNTTSVTAAPTPPPLSTEASTAPVASPTPATPTTAPTTPTTTPGKPTTTPGKPTTAPGKPSIAASPTTSRIKPQPSTTKETTTSASCQSYTFGSLNTATAKTAVSKVTDKYGVKVSVAWQDPQQGIVEAGNMQSPAAWSTSKVPLALAVIQAGNQSKQLSNIQAALQLSDNSAAAALWTSLGTSNSERARAVTAILRKAGDNKTTVPTSQTYAPYSIFGQTKWSTSDQVAFAMKLPCMEGSGPVISAMGKVDQSQQWGMGRLPQATFKGGWGPTRQGGYLVRQFGWFTNTQGQRVAFAMAVQAGSFDGGITVLNALADDIASA